MPRLLEGGVYKRAAFKRGNTVFGDASLCQDGHIDITSPKIDHMMTSKFEN